ncbi:MAG: T9SS type A sorting domain-containing protein, partial [Bacteroidetes bacterium]|nr:T9SS type A sorting domain-containing protein [Bacteroidota bacterium]
VINALGPLRNNFLRFPGGTISQYYHFRGENGYGTNSFDLDCREGFLDLPGFSQKVRVDQFYPRNMIDQYIDLVHALDTYTEDSIQTLYVINLMTHFFNGDLVPWNAFLDELITSYGSSLNVFLDLNPSLMDDQAMDEAVNVMRNIFRDPAIDNLIEWLVQQPGFQDRLTENLEAIGYLLQNDIPIAGIELGNENYSFDMLRDDDLSNIPFDCTTPDSIVLENWPITLPLRAYMQAILKYSMLSSIYSSLVKDIWSLPTGAVLNSTAFGIDILTLDRFTIEESTTEKARYFELWNRFIGGQDFYDAVIPHIYMKSLPVCEALEDLGADSIAKFGKHYLDFYFSDVLEYQLDKIGAQANGRPMWITEWNINTANVFGNTFLHASHCFQFMNNLNEIADEHNIRLINYHNLASWVYNQFALIRTEEVNGRYTVNLQSTYHPFKLMGDTHANGDIRSNVDLDTWIGNNYESGPNHYFYSYLSNDGKQLIVNFINQAPTNLNIPLEDIIFNVEIDNQTPVSMYATGHALEYIDATSLFGSNRGCDDYTEYFDDYAWVTLEDSGKDFSLPSYSLGKLTIDLSVRIGINEINKQHYMRAYPNPVSGSFTVEIDGLNQVPEPVLDIYDIAGKIIDSRPAEERMQLSVNHLSSGLYMLQLVGNDRQTYATRKLVINSKN